jgi:hypothetical protein
MNRKIYDNDLEQSVQKKLQPLRSTPPRDSHAIKTGKERFLSQAAEIRANLPVSKVDGSRLIRQKRTLSKLFGWRKEPVPMFAQIGLAVLLVITLFAGGGGATVYASQTSQPPDLLYPVKTWSEEVRYELTNSEMEQLQLSLQFTERRLEELQWMQQNQILVNEALIERLQSHLQDTLQLMTRLQLSEQDQLQIRDRLRAQDRLMDQLHLKEGISENPLFLQVRTMLREQLRLAGADPENPLQTQQQQQNGQTDETSDPQQPGQGPQNQNGMSESAGVCQDNQTNCEPVETQQQEQNQQQNQDQQQNQQQNQDQNQDHNQDQNQQQGQTQQQEPAGEPSPASPEPGPKGGK